MHEELIETLRLTALSVADNAASIVGAERFLDDITVTIQLRPNSDRIPIVKVERNFIPDKIITKGEK